MTPAERPPGGLLLLAPLSLEARALRAGLRGLPAGAARVERTGMGLGRAAAAARRLREAPGAGGWPAAVAVAGIGGALVGDLRPGTLVVADRILDEHGRPVGPPLASAPLLAAALCRAGLRAVVGPVASSRRVVRGPARAALAATGAVVVEMESAALLAEPWGVPTAVVRAVVDGPDQELASPATLTRGLVALRALRAAAPVLVSWASAAGPRRVVLASPRSFCAGVERAIQTVEAALDHHGPPVHVRRQIVHNRHVVASLEARGAVFVQELDEVPDGATVVFSAHGVSPAVRADAVARDLRVIDATCPLVAKVHREVHRFRDAGYQVVLVGHRGHDEIEGTLGEADGIQLVERVEDVAGLDVADPARVAYITQTTLAPDDVAEIVAALQARFPALVGPHATDICYATQNRQEAVRAIAGECDLLLVIGSRNSSNANRLVEVARRAGCRAELVDDERDLALEWLAGTAAIGVTAAASAPEAVVQQVVGALEGLGPIDVDRRSVRAETVSFPLPVEVR